MSTTNVDIIEQLRYRTTCSVPEAGRALGIGRNNAYAAAADGSLPTLRFGKRLVVPTAKLLALLGIDDTEQARGGDAA